MIYTFVIDYGNSNEYFNISIESPLPREDVERYLQQYSRCVVYVNTKDKRQKKQKGHRKIPVGIIVGCSFRFEGWNTFGGQKLKGVDSRHEVYSMG
jgi:hypothetical protein